MIHILVSSINVKTVIIFILLLQYIHPSVFLSDSVLCSKHVCCWWFSDVLLTEHIIQHLIKMWEWLWMVNWLTYERQPSLNRADRKSLYQISLTTLTGNVFIHFTWIISVCRTGRKGVTASRGLLWDRRTNEVTHFKE